MTLSLDDYLRFSSFRFMRTKYKNPDTLAKESFVVFANVPRAQSGAVEITPFEVGLQPLIFPDFGRGPDLSGIDLQFPNFVDTPPASFNPYSSDDPTLPGGTAPGLPPLPDAPPFGGLGDLPNAIEPPDLPPFGGDQPMDFHELPPLPGGLPLPDQGTFNPLAPDSSSPGIPPTQQGGGGASGGSPGGEEGGQGQEGLRVETSTETRWERAVVPGEVVSGSGDEYVVNIYPNGTVNDRVEEVDVIQLLIAEDATIPPGTMTLVFKAVEYEITTTTYVGSISGTVYGTQTQVKQVSETHEMQVPVWM